MDLTEHRESDTEQERSSSLFQLFPDNRHTALDIGARDGHFTKLLAQRFDHVTALDLSKPQIDHEKVSCVKGDVTNLTFKDNSFDFILCAEVLEHIPPTLLQKACEELCRVSNELILIGVPYKQDLRVDRTTCYSCGAKNPPWGHVNSFDEERLMKLFHPCKAIEIELIGSSNDFTNFISTALTDFAGNPYGTYFQEEACINCGKKLIPPPSRTLIQRIATKSASQLRRIQRSLSQPQANWIHILFKKDQ